MNKLATALLVLTGSLCGCGGSAPQKPETGLKDLKPTERSGLRTQLIETMVNAKAYDSAVPLLRQALREQPNSATAHYLLATVLRERGRLEQAVAEFSVALKLNKELAAAHTGLGMTLNLLGRHETATASHLRAAKRQPKNGRIQNNLGFSLYLQKEFSDAEAAYERAIRADPQLRIAYINLGFALAAQKKHDAAKRAFSQVLTPAEVTNNLAVAEELRGDDEAARRLYREALVLDPGLQDAISNLSAISASETKEEER